MSRKNTNDQGFGDLEDDFFNSGPSDWGEAPTLKDEAKLAEEAKKAAALEAEQKAAAAKKAEAEARAAAEQKAKAEAAEAEARAKAEAAEAAQKAEAARSMEAAKKAEAARVAEAAREAEAAAARREEEARQAALEADARKAARGMQDQATRVFKRKSKAELLAQEDAEDALVEAALAATPRPPAEAPAEAVVEPTVEEAPAAVEAAPAVAVAEVPADEPPPPVVVAPPVAVETPVFEPAPLPPSIALLPTITSEDSAETEVVSGAETEELPSGAPVLAAEAVGVAPAAMLAWTPPADARSAWREAVVELEAEAQAATGENKALLYGAAAHLARVRVVDLELAGRLLTASQAASARPASAPDCCSRGSAAGTVPAPWRSGGNNVRRAENNSRPRPDRRSSARRARAACTSRRYARRCREFSRRGHSTRKPVSAGSGSCGDCYCCCHRHRHRHRHRCHHRCDRAYASDRFS